MDIVEISAKNEINIDLLMDKITTSLPRTMKRVELLIPYSDTSINAYLHRNAIIESESYEADGTLIVATVSDEIYNKCANFIIKEI